MHWNDAVLEGVRRLCLRKNVCLFSRHMDDPRGVAADRTGYSPTQR